MTPVSRFHGLTNACATGESRSNRPNLTTASWLDNPVKRAHPPLVPAPNTLAFNCCRSARLHFAGLELSIAPHLAPHALPPKMINGYLCLLPLFIAAMVDGRMVHQRRALPAGVDLGKPLVAVAVQTAQCSKAPAPTRPCNSVSLTTARRLPSNPATSRNSHIPAPR
jgi:hypothetical protein